MSTHRTSLHLAVIGAGPVGLALALQAARVLPHAQVTLFDARALDGDVAADARTLALSLGSVQLLQRLGAWPDAPDAAADITEVHVSQQAPLVAEGLSELLGAPEVWLRAAELQLPRLGAVLRYGTLVTSLQAAWLRAAQAAPERLRTRFGTPVQALKPLPGAVEVDAGIAEAFDVAVVAEGGVYAQTPSRQDTPVRAALTHDYGQTAWVGTVTLQGGTPGQAFERFTRHGPLALLPLPDTAEGQAAGTRRSALVWCVSADDDPVRELSDSQRLAVLATLFPPGVGRLQALSPLKHFPLGLKAERSLVDGRTVKIGNAAQTLHPVAGQGLNLGLRDAYALVDALRWTPDVDAALQRVAWQRAPDRWAMIATTDFLARSFTWQLPGAATARALGLAALQATPPLKAWLARRMMFGAR
jgi:2-octaprenyl-6-methoxyphenol hydroxylase